MSQGQLEQAVQQAIISKVVKLSEQEGQVELNKKTGKYGIASGTELDSDNIREISNRRSSGYESIVSAGGLKNLALDVEQKLKESEAETDLVQSLIPVLSSDTLFNEFVEFAQEAYGSKDSKYKLGAFSYTKFRDSNNKELARVGISETNSDTNFISFKDKNHGELKKLFVNEFLAKRKNLPTEAVEYLVKNIDAGHLTGVFNIKFKRAFDLKVTQSSVKDYRTLKVTNTGTSEVSESTADIFRRMLLLLADADFLSSNIFDNLELFSTTSKLVYSRGQDSVAAELQLSANNQKIGSALGAIGRGLNTLLVAKAQLKTRANIDKLGASNALSQIFKNLDNLAEIVKSKAETIRQQVTTKNPVLEQKLLDILKDTETVQKLVLAKGSDSLLDSYAKRVIATLNGSKLPAQQKTTVKTKTQLTSNKPVKKVDVPSIKVPKSRKNIFLRDLEKKSITPNLTNLQALLQQGLHDQIRKNMGTGSSTRVLNYRTGRFARSAKIERLTQSREGLITAFYSYMQNPYATFSKDGAQSKPRTRDPKTLISGSIRELAATQVSNRLRAVLV